MQTKSNNSTFDVHTDCIAHAHRCAVMTPCYIAGHTQWQIFRRGPCKRQSGNLVQHMRAQTTKNAPCSTVLMMTRARLAPIEDTLNLDLSFFPRRFRVGCRIIMNHLDSIESPQTCSLWKVHQGVGVLGCTLVKVPNSYSRDAMKNPETSNHLV